jgi:hypothetical protein
MSLLLVTYDPNNPKRDYSDLLDEIGSYSNIRLSDFAYAIITDKPPSRICGELKQYIDANDKILVINLKRPFDGYGSDEVNDWLKKTLVY